MSLSTHVLDTARGVPAEGVPITLERETEDGWEVLTQAETNDDGRVQDFIAADRVTEGVYKITFHTQAYFEKHDLEGFYPYVPILFVVRDASEHYHVPLLLSPYGISTYRGVLMPALSDDTLDDILGRLEAPNAAWQEACPGESDQRQPIHTVYGGAQLFKHDTAVRLGELARKHLAAYAPDAATLALTLELPDYEQLLAAEPYTDSLFDRVADDPEAMKDENPGVWLAHTVYERVKNKLEAEPVEDFRIDFEDGFGTHSDQEEDKTAIRCAKEVAKGMREDTLPPFIGIRIKSFAGETARRGARTLNLFLSTLLEETDNQLPDPFLVTLPKVPLPEHVTALCDLLDAIEDAHMLPRNTVKVELMVELTQSLFDRDGVFLLPALHQACRGRLFAAHFGTYDFTASYGVTAAHQRMDHPSCDFAKHLMVTAFAGTGVFLSDGATNVMPVGPHKDPENELEEAENQRVVHDAWKLMYDHVRHSLEGGYYQGWDLHPGQLAIRYAAAYAFFLEGADAAAERLTNFIEKAGQATLVGDVFDDAATGQGLLNYFLRGLSSGAVTLDEVLATGLTPDEIRTRSFKAILEGRRG